MKTTPKKKRANRRNAKKSTGPRTPAGKDLVAKNGLVHGLCSLEPVVDGSESIATWKRHRQEIVSRLSPEGAVEGALAEQIALGYWRLARCARVEAEAISALREQAWWRAVRMGLDCSAVHAEGVAEAFRSFEKSCCSARHLACLWDRLLEEAEADTPVEAGDADLLFGDAVPDRSWRKLADAFNAAFRWPPNTYAELREMLDWWGPRIYAEPGAWMLGKRSEALEDARRAEGRLEWIRQSAELESSLALLDSRLSGSLQRYETSIHRRLHRDLHEFQRIQAMRLGVADVVPKAIDLSLD